MDGEYNIMKYKLNRAWAEIDLDAIAHNVREIKGLTGEKVELMGVVKADAYGHGVQEVVRTLLGSGVSQLAVSTLDEAIQIRQLGIGVPILILSCTDPGRADEIVLNDITQTIYSFKLAQAMSEASARLNRSARIHIKTDTGMSRIGYLPGCNAVKEIIEIARLPGIITEGLFTHFASADEHERDYTLMQFDRYMNLVNELKKAGLHIPVRHVCNSAGILQYPEMHLDLVRPGIILYGLYPSNDVDKGNICLKPAMTLKANVIMIKDVEADTCISYGRTFRTARKSRIATISIGYADGYSRLLSNKGRIILDGEYAPVVGRICMDQCMVDVSNLKNEVHVGDEAVIFGCQKGASIGADEVASEIGTIGYEVVCNIGKRIPRVYLKEGRIYSVLNYLIKPRVTES